MIKKLLLKLARRILKHYNNAAHVELDSMIVFQEGNYDIVEIKLHQRIGCIDCLEINAYKRYPVEELGKCQSMKNQHCGVGMLELVRNIVKNSKTPN